MAWTKVGNVQGPPGAPTDAATVVVVNTIDDVPAGLPAGTVVLVKG